MREVSIKIGNMRKAQDFVIYPDTGSGKLTLQSKDCIISVNVLTGEAKWVRQRGGAYFSHLIIGGDLGNGTCVFTQDELLSLKDVQPKVGDKIGSGVFIG